MAVTVSGVKPRSPAARKRVAAGDVLVSINGQAIDDVLDYRFYLTDEVMSLCFETARGIRTVKLRPNRQGELGMEFDTYLMDKQRACRNKCIFCFIDQLPHGLRDSLYFKDDDSRLSFLFGNYITLTNLTDRDVDRIIEMHISPVNISVHTTDPTLRCRMMNNRFAGDALQYLYRLAEAGIALNCQLVLCPGYNDGEALTRTMEDLAALFPSVQSVAAVPVGLTKFREGLTELRAFTSKEAADVIVRMEAMADRQEAAHGHRIFYPSDEFYLTAGKPIPAADCYGDFLQLENGVGMIALMREEFYAALEEAQELTRTRRLAVATGVSAAPLMEELVAAAKAKFPALQAEVKTVANRFFGESITVAGLITGTDLIEQLQGSSAEEVTVPRCMLRREGDLFLDDTTPRDVEEALGVPVVVNDGDGADFLRVLLGG